MKKILTALTMVVALTACSNNGGESGAVNDGFNGMGDTNGGLPDTGNANYNPRIERDKGEHRVDLERRDSARNDTVIH